MGEGAFLQTERYVPTGYGCLHDDKSLSAEKRSGKVLAVRTCLRACVGNSGICCQGVCHLSPTLPKHRGIINYSGNANPANLPHLLSEQRRASVTDPVGGPPGPKGERVVGRHCATQTHSCWHLIGTSVVRLCRVRSWESRMSIPQD